MCLTNQNLEDKRIVPYLILSSDPVSISTVFLKYKIRDLNLSTLHSKKKP